MRTGGGLVNSILAIRWVGGKGGGGGGGGSGGGGGGGGGVAECARADFKI